MRAPLLFTLVLVFTLCQLGWWCFYLWEDSGRIAAAGRALAAGEPSLVASSFDVETAEELTALGERRRIMFASEAGAFVVLLLVLTWLFAAAHRREQHLHALQHRFLAGATHDLKTPLATLRLGLESLQTGNAPPERRERYVSAMLGEVDRLEDGVTNLLTAAGLRAVGRRLQPEPGDLAEDVRRAVEAIAPRAEAAGVAVETQIRSAPVERDPEAVRLVLHNLLDNAVKYSGRGDRVVVSLDTEDHYAVLIVRDEGMGMEPRELEQAFEPFYRGTSGSSTGGAGLGLHLVQELLHGHGGTVRGHSEGSGCGSTFTVRLPLRAEADR